MPREDTQFEKGNPGGPGRPKGSKNGRKRFLDEVDKVIGGLLDEDEVRVAIYDDFRAKIIKNPGAFFVKIGLPSLPREILMRHTGDEKAILRLELVKPKPNGEDKGGGG